MQRRSRKECFSGFAPLVPVAAGSCTEPGNAWHCLTPRWAAHPAPTEAYPTADGVKIAAANE